MHRFVERGGNMVSIRVGAYVSQLKSVEYSSMEESM
jgi:hypothetical protein